MQLPETVEVKGMRVLTSKQLAECYGTTTAMIKKNFSNNRERYLDGKHYISLTGDDLKAFKKQVTQCNLVENDQVKKVHLVNNRVGKSYLVDGRASHLYLWTEKGALLHAKSLNTDKAWEVYDYLVDFYFRAKEKAVEPEKKEIVPAEVREDAGTSEAPPENTDKKPFDIAPVFRQVLTMLPTEALDEMERSFRSCKAQAVKLAAVSILAEKMKRELAE